jgi:hypothetical protein
MFHGNLRFWSRLLPDLNSKLALLSIQWCSLVPNKIISSFAPASLSYPNPICVYGFFLAAEGHVMNPCMKNQRKQDTIQYHDLHIFCARSVLVPLSSTGILALRECKSRKEPNVRKCVCCRLCRDYQLLSLRCWVLCCWPRWPHQRCASQDICFYFISSLCYDVNYSTLPELWLELELHLPPVIALQAVSEWTDTIWK